MRSAAVMVRSSVIYNKVASAPMVQSLSRRFQKMPEMIGRSYSVKTSFSMIEAMVRMSEKERVVLALVQMGSTLL